MATPKRTAPTAKAAALPKGGSKALPNSAEAETAEKDRIAKIALDPAASGMATALAFSKGTFGATDTNALYTVVQAKIATVRGGDMSGPEAILVGQATALNLVFTELSRRSALNMGEYIEAAERYMRLALKAQAQCRATIETLAALKNPPVVYARQANISAGHQQINNHSAPGSPTRAEKLQHAPNELLETESAKSIGLDAGAAGAAARCHQELAALGAIDRPEDGRGQVSEQSQC